MRRLRGVVIVVVVLPLPLVVDSRVGVIGVGPGEAVRKGEVVGLRVDPRIEPCLVLVPLPIGRDVGDIGDIGDIADIGDIGDVLVRVGVEIGGVGRVVGRGRGPVSGAEAAAAAATASADEKSPV